MKRHIITLLFLILTFSPVLAADSLLFGVPEILKMGGGIAKTVTAALEDITPELLKSDLEECVLSDDIKRSLKKVNQEIKAHNSSADCEASEEQYATALNTVNTKIDAINNELMQCGFTDLALLPFKCS